MKKLLALIILLFTSNHIFSQMMVWDMTSVETLIANHKVQHAHFKEMKEKEGQIATIQRKISEQMVQIEFFKTKLYNSLKDVSLIVKTGKDVIYAKDIAKDIAKYQTEVAKLAVGDPKLVLIAAQTQMALVNKTTDLMKYIYETAIIGTDFNLMDNKQRLDLVQYVIRELRTMRGIAYSIARQMKTAKRVGILHAISPSIFKKDKDATKKLIDDIINDRY
ncbi:MULTISPECIES: hypothetical protein [Capnocytophaga]|uniref:Plasmid transfer protein n=1 Tax=Capnocytophaga canis TaxID=1848903 RepID=A0A0B7IME0_9FLAO|nr:MULTISPECIES: hypothetical protein [Capnocytophaga]GJQ04032.1 hypothetical protein CAPN009_04470 [Capnocytophaga canimorsus]CEN53040.1 conserved exported hypothetical protein [Capnocytophaga canis]